MKRLLALLLFGPRRSHTPPPVGPRPTQPPMRVVEYDRVSIDRDGNVTREHLLRPGEPGYEP